MNMPLNCARNAVYMPEITKYFDGSSSSSPGLGGRRLASDDVTDVATPNVNKPPPPPLGVNWVNCMQDRPKELN
jgi:hypothetical protein